MDNLSQFIYTMFWNLKNFRASPLLLICVIMAMLLVMKYTTREGMTNIPNPKFQQLVGDAIFTPQYVSIFDTLFRVQEKDNFEVAQVAKFTEMGKDSHVLDIGCSTGHRAALLQKVTSSVKGVDSSANMIKKAKRDYPSLDLVVDNIIEPSKLIDRKLYTHVTVLYFEVYRHKDKHRLFRILNGMLVPGGKLAVHLVDRNKFDPIVPAANPIQSVSPQDYAKKRLTRSEVLFNTCSYVASLEEPSHGDNYTFVETITPKDGGRPTQNRHALHMPRQKDVLAAARDAGFTITGRFSLEPVGYYHNQVYILQKAQ